MSRARAEVQPSLVRDLDSIKYKIRWIGSSYSLKLVRLTKRVDSTRLVVVKGVEFGQRFRLDELNELNWFDPINLNSNYVQAQNSACSAQLTILVLPVINQFSFYFFFPSEYGLLFPSEWVYKQLFFPFYFLFWIWKKFNLHTCKNVLK